MPEPLPPGPANGQHAHGQQANGQHTNGEHVNPPSTGEASVGPRVLRDTDLAPYAEMIQCLKDLRDQYEVSEKLLGLLGKAQFQREQTMRQINKGLASMEKFSKDIERMVKDEFERRVNTHEGLKAWVRAIDRIQGKEDLDESADGEPAADEPSAEAEESSAEVGESSEEVQEAPAEASAEAEVEE